MENQKYTEVPSHPRLNSYLQENSQQGRLTRMWETGVRIAIKPSSFTTDQDGNDNILLLKSVWRFFTQLKIELPYDPATLFWVSTQIKQKRHTLYTTSHHVDHSTIHDNQDISKA